ncbi:MAG: thiamine pyrophosphate-dependent enzyme [Patescibacteria group bacterium]|nr:thiamine pyrophosphate-dependent enzyme [Patescibacteria group bacterium]
MTEIKIGDVLIAPGHRACAGCGQMIAAIAASRAMGPDVIIANATGCLEVTTTPYPETSWKVPWIHSLFENPAAVASGIRAALDYKNSHPQNHPQTPPSKGGEIKVIVQGGDGSTFDIGFGLISGMWERGENILYICYDTEVYSNTGVQASSATPPGASTTTTPPGKFSLGSTQRKKDMLAIALAHGVKYIAQSTAGYPLDITAKVRKGIETNGPAYIQIMSPCIPGFGIKTSEAMQVAKLAVSTGLYPLLEYVDGQLVNVSKIQTPVKVEEYLKIQSRFKHLFSSDAGKKEIEYIQELANQNIKKYKLVD